jgi:PhnB protein
MVTRPERYRNTIVAHIYIENASKAIGFYKRAFGAEELFRIARFAARSSCSATRMTNSTVNRGYWVDAPPASTFLLDDNTALLRRAIEAGAQEIQPPTDMFYGANSASLRDPFGHVWVLLT